MKDVIIEMFLALAAVNVATKQFSCYPEVISKVFNLEGRKNAAEGSS